jgi:hypothetical protein
MILAGITLALCGCTSADGPVFSSQATKATGANAAPPVQEQSRDVYEQLKQGTDMGNAITPPGGGAYGNNTSAAAPMQQVNPYAH